jgi:enediyne biosynthesis protein E4
VTTLPRQTYGVFHNDGHGAFSEQGLQTGISMLSGVTSGWGVGLEDFDNDGQKDLFIAQGHVLDNVEKIDPSLHYLEPMLLALNHGGHFDSVDPGTTALFAARGAAFGDLNNDGWMDAVVTILGGHPQVFMNRTENRENAHWLTITLRGTRSNRDGLGARVQVNGQTRFCTTAGSYESANDKRLHFGLGAAKTAKIEVSWPSGTHQVLNDIKADQFLEAREPEHP